jgi:uncharacterized protein (DUF608 family)/antitoxin (DNA-binding transcriptional repressor) of toxin-antitoxin stability system
MDRRSFLKASAAAGALGLWGPGLAAGAQELAALKQRWFPAGGWAKGERPVYYGEQLEYIAMPLGGIGTGQVYLQGRGTLGPWQIMNNFNSNAQAPGALFGLWTRRAEGAAQALLLQEGDLDGIPAMPAVAFAGEYPFAWIDYKDGDHNLPVSVSLEAFSPMVPLDVEASALPAVIFKFTLKNRTKEAVEASILAAMPNLVGWEGYLPLEGTRHAEYGGNQNLFEQAAGAAHLRMGAVPGRNQSMSAPCVLATDELDVAYALRTCEGVSVHHHASIPRPEAEEPIVYWTGEASDAVADAALSEVLDAVESGGTLIIAGADKSIATIASQRREKDAKHVVFEDWESSDYEGWTIDGEAFGPAPAAGTLPWQSPVSGFRGKQLVNTFFNGDATTGTARSEVFPIQHDFIHLLVGGGQNEDQTAIRLIVDGQVVHAATGLNTEVVRPVRWDVGHLRDKEAVLEIIDTAEGGWGHILVDDIVFSNSVASPYLSGEFARNLYDALPVKWDDFELAEGPLALADVLSLHAALEGAGIQAGRHWRITKKDLKRGSDVLLSGEDGTPLVVQGRYGKGTVIFCNGDPAAWAMGNVQKALIGAIVAKTTGADYTPRESVPPTIPGYGSMQLSVLGDGVTATAQWNDVQALWRDFAEDGRLNPSDAGPSASGYTWNGALAAPVQLAPEAKADVYVLLSWHFPTRFRTPHYGWAGSGLQYDHRLGNHYNTRFADASAVADHCLAHLQELESRTRAFHRAFYDSSLPQWFLDCLTANAAIIRSPIYVHIEDGTVGGFEGTDSCCPMNCTHVYNYAMSLAYLYPALERNVRETDLLRQMHPEEHYIPHRTILPLSLPRLENVIGGPHQHALDGELGTILKTLREFQLMGDRAWLESLYPNLKLVMEHVLKDHDVAGDGVIRGSQPNTYDIHTYGSNTFLGTLYLAALRATEEMARVMDDGAFADTCRARFESGSKGYDATCWDGEYYYNVYDASGEKPDIYNHNNCWGPGCHADQLLGQWWAHILGLGYLLPKERVHGGLQALYKYNFRADLSDHVHSQRIFAEGKEGGLLICTWPKGGRPENPINYCDEVWTGIEYAVAGLMLFEGMTQEAADIVTAARRRYTGEQRNPWSEIECGGHYARAMACHALLPAATGYHYDAGSGRLQVAPVVNADNFKAFFTTGQAWGRLAYRHDGQGHEFRLEPEEGQVRVAELRLPLQGTGANVRVDGASIQRSEAKDGTLQLELTQAIEVSKEAPLRISYS